MSVGGVNLTSLLTGSASTAFGFALGFAASEALRPEATRISQEAWSVDPQRVLDPEIAAGLVAEALSEMSWGEGEAAQSGMDQGRFDSLVRLLKSAPDVNELLSMRRRDTISETDLRFGFRKHKLEDRYDGALIELLNARLTPEAVAVAIQRGQLPAGDFLPVAPPTTSDTIAYAGPVPLDPFDQAKAAGISRDQLKVLTRSVGLPPGPQELLALYNRGVITRNDYELGIAQGNLRNEWRDALFALRRRLITPNEYAELRLRGWIDDSAMYAGARLSGLRDGDTDLLHKMQGRPIPVHQVRTGEARGGTFDGDTSAIPRAYLRSLEEGNLRPEWYNLAYANRFTLPSAFVIRNLVTTGAITAAEAEQLFLHSGWPPDLASKVATALSKGAPSTVKRTTATQLLDEYEGHYMTEADLRTRLERLGYGPTSVDEYVELGNARRVARARTSRLNRIHSRYVGHKIKRAETTAALAKTGIPTEAQDLLLHEWDEERDVNAATLTPAQLKRAYKRDVYDLPTTIERLEDAGYSGHDAYVYLDLKPPVGV